ncbi:hypothetical protein FRC08_002056 [Ceratobasidium sp. 394]|nr:hypothetical protein FRC08_002056 [Ceratobasidium sp. 394]
MDEAGYHARKRAARQDARYNNPQLGSSGRYDGVEVVQPLNEPWVGGFQAQGRMPVPQARGTMPIPVPPQHGYAEPSPRPSAWVPEIRIPGTIMQDCECALLVLAKRFLVGGMLRCNAQHTITPPPSWTIFTEPSSACLITILQPTPTQAPPTPALP